MERLTDTINGVVVYVGPGNEFKNGLIPAELSPDQVRTAMRRLAAYEDTGLTPERCAELAEADKDGRLAVLPCRLGDAVFTIYQDCVMECSVESVNMSKFAGGTVVLCRKGRWADQYGLPFSKFNSGTFATREEAEQALKEAKDDG